ncbi:SDR family oxidoreductase [Amycolatopsis panacis]|uniref:SDR family oxidoreductase n=1 Tax=Amycolatopsis panacis TaxID=2340917 RepID=A0A419I2K8_9PSEU|nr:SDR family oxidoreductase [Amycolatopsis panacis]RJQ84189.1 SDR family oxidoreductase [Amycolatopsis panacis]
MNSERTINEARGTDWLASMFGLPGQTAVVTGGTRGIGYMIAEGLLRAGAAVILCARHQEDCDTAARQLSPFGEVMGVRADLSTTGGCESFARLVSTHTDSIDVLVNNAGASWGAAIEEYPEAAWDKVLGLNLKAPFFLTQQLLPLLRRGATPDDPSRVINIGSIDGLVVPSVPNYAYAASKAAIHHLTRAMARDLAESHVLVNAIAPGPFESKMMSWMLRNFEQRIKDSSPLGRVGSAIDMAAAVVYLAGRGSGYVTGAVLPVDGGIATTISSPWAEDL